MNPGGRFVGGRPVGEYETTRKPRYYWAAGWPVLFFTLVVSGCAGQVADQPEPQVVRVEVPVQVPCRTDRVQKPAFAVGALPIGASIDKQMRALRAERKQRQAYELRLEAAIEACQ